MFGLASYNSIIGPYIMPSPINGNNYRVFLVVLPELLENVPLAVRRRMRFQQDGAPAHFHNGVRNCLNVQFINKWIDRNGPVTWPPKSSDMTSNDFFLGRGGTLKPMFIHHLCNQRKISGQELQWLPAIFLK